MIRTFVLFLALFFASSAGAQINYGAASGYVNPAPLNSLNGTADFERFMRGVTGGKADVVDRYTGRIGGKSFPVDVVRQFDKAAAIRGLAKLGRASIQGAVIGAAIEGLLDRTHCSLSLSGSGLSCDPLASPSVELRWRHPDYTAGQVIKGYSSPSSAITAWVYWYARQMNQVLGQVQAANCNGATCSIVYYWQQPGYEAFPYNRSEQFITFQSEPAPVCAPPNVFYGELCTTGQRATVQEEALHGRVSPGMTDADVEPIVRRLVELGADPVPATTKLEGPARLEDTPTTRTTTRPDGSTATSTTQNIYNVSYDQRQFNWSTTTVNTAEDGTVTEESDKPKEKTQCELTPNAVGCMELGEPPSGEVEKRTEVLSFSAESISLPSGCPAPVSLPGGKVVDYSPICQTASSFRPFVIAAAAMSACLMVLAAVRF